jgi:hypothetical protein
VITPSFPTFAKAVAINSPITSSLLAEIEAICLILSESVPTTLIVLLSQLQ